MTEVVDVSDCAGTGRLSRMADGMVGSEILKIAADIRALIRSGTPVCNLTVGDFAPKHFPIPQRLSEGISQALQRGETNYPPSNGLPELREAVRRFYASELGLAYPIESILIAGGARPSLYAAYRALVDPGDVVVYPTPSWNNNHYCQIVGARGVPVPCRPQERFLPTRASLVAALPGARLVCVNSPLNPTGTAISAESLGGICEAILDENARREKAGERPLYLLYDQIYWMLTVPGVSHVTPPGLIPEMARYTVLVDGISKAFAATGVRVGWAVGPADVVEKMATFLGHVGAWAPRAEQAGTVHLLEGPQAIREFGETFRRAIQERLQTLHLAFESMRAEGLPVESLAPMGAIYLTVRIHPFGRSAPGGKALRSNEDVRAYLLDQARVGIVPFQAFGVPEDTGWFRLSVGAVGQAELEEALPRLRKALLALA